MIKVGDVFKSNNYGDVIVTRYVSCREVHFVFKTTGFKTSAQAQQLRKGTIKDWLQPSVAGVGFIGEGKYSRRTHERAYSSWSSMLNRCYNVISLENTRGAYEGVTVRKLWHNFQNFAKWFTEHSIEGYDLDKDKRIPGCREYSEDSCSFIPSAENSAIACSTGITYTLLSPEGKEHVFENQKIFAETHKLDRSTLSKLLRGIYKQHKGWKLPVIEV